ncbi:UDP-N-acetylmuramate--L-alanine ligase [Chlorobium phaeobacteroides]|uniref:UDP-N-acetylmuramate--L-alanine ligase n=1 Tax=Chlorobium phaeobacteroides (strain DSM 266 / SMG 266 / 2430) TaxID=290317 RepID=A1BHK8_CHLPD|nr:Mur ligase family protein [Chlorobium phaeobacteroides]ABL65885.1 UDP-N-acetylmuramate--L-alanine ligase [Chlorobium phaeobacteroides DSM 266]
MSSIYFLGIGGTAMASVAVALSHSGHAVSGSDTQLYPPMSNYLDTHNIRYFSGFSEENIQKASADLVVAGNAISRGNIELEYALNNRMELISMPDLVRRELIAQNTSLVVTGTHGKTTTTSLLAWLLQHGGLKPGFLVGGIPENFPVACRASGRSENGFFVSEGDEYDTAFFDKRSKFLLYRPDVVIINNIEFDHADIFNSLDDIKRSFRLLVNLIPGNGLLLVNGDAPDALAVASRAFCRVERFGLNGNSEWSARNISLENSLTGFDLYYKGNLQGTCHVPLFGSHNIMNTIAAVAAAIHSGISFDSIAAGLPLFKRPKRRMEITDDSANRITLIEDFAHHPTAVKATLEAIADLYPKRRIIACFEPRSNTTTRNIFQNELAACFDPASIVIMGMVHRPERYRPEERLDTERLKNELENKGKTVFLAGENPSIYPQDIIGFITTRLQPEDVVVLLSNGSFSNLKQGLFDSLKK